jgi:triosephosphate isomerase (TIM)
MRLPRPVVLGNWKMNGRVDDAQALVGALKARAGDAATGTLGVFPPATLIERAREWLAGTPIFVGAQDCHSQASGAYTGDLAAPMLAEAGAQAVICGHSERRQYHFEDDASVRAKAEAGLDAGLKAVVCIGETEAEYLAGRTLERLDAQLAGSLPDASTAGDVVVAYEPVWAIGTGRTPSDAEIEAAHDHIRTRLVERFAEGGDIAILYGGSVKPSNAKAILTTSNVDGALVGGASLDADDFWAIYEAGSGAPG